jgi:pimeloyl-ACP methyl ester carboxylesterase/DNA-binding SARP family transcriptional activator
VQVRVLGPVSVADGAGREVAGLERKGRELLTVLALRAPSAVALHELVDVLWDSPPASAVKSIRAHLSRVRAALRRAGLEGAVERAGSGGYRLQLPAGTTDLDAVASLRRRARELLGDGQRVAAAAALTDARRVWRGEPELPGTVAGLTLARGWQREHRQLVLEHLRCVVDGPDPSQALGELQQLTMRDPTDEPMWVLHVLALHRSGHQVEATRALASARTALSELGLDPGAELRRAETEVFADPAVSPRSDLGDEAPVQYAVDRGVHVAYSVLSSGPRDLVVLNPAMITIDGLLAEPHARDALGRLAEHARVVCFDRRGVGLSDPLDPQGDPLDAWTQDLTQVLDAVGIGTAHLLANFDTGLVALEYAARHPERVASLVLAHCFATYHRSEDYPHGLELDTVDQLIRDAISPEQPDHRVDTVAHATPSLAHQEEFRRWWTRIGQRGAGPATATAIRTIAVRADVRDRLADISAPTLVLHRRSCVNVDPGHARYLASHIPGAQLEIVPGTDSLWFTDTPDLLDRAIAFLRAWSPPEQVDPVHLETRAQTSR